MTELFHEPKRLSFLIEKVMDLSVWDLKSKKIKISITGGKKRCSSESVPYNNGFAHMNCNLEIKLFRGQSDAICLIVSDTTGHKQYGQVTISMNKLSSLIHSDNNHLQNYYPQSSDLEPTKKCEEPTGILFYQIKIEEFFSNTEEVSGFGKRGSIFSLMSSRKPSISKSSTHINYDEKLEEPTKSEHKIVKRFSLFKANNNQNDIIEKRSKAKSLANIYTIEDIESSEHSNQSLTSFQDNIPPEEMYHKLSQDLGWMRVCDIVTSIDCNGEMDSANDMKKDVISQHCVEAEKVELWSVQPDHGPISGNFTVVIEGCNFSLGLYELTFVCIDGLEPLDATEVTEVLSDNEILLTMPEVPEPRIISIYFEMLDGYRIKCAKKFHYVATDESNFPVLTPRNFEQVDKEVFILDRIIDRYDDENSYNKSNSSGSGQIMFHANSYYPNSDSQVNGNNNVNDDQSDLTISSNRPHHSDNESQLSDNDRQNLNHFKKKRKSGKITLSKTKLYKEVIALRGEVDVLRKQLNDNNSQIVTLKYELDSTNSEIDNISKCLCNLKVRLLEDGLTKYLELN